MEVFVLCGGFGTRLDHQSKLIAKPMVRIGKEPILYYIMENFAKQNMNTFVLCLGYKKETIINYFLKEKKKYIKINYKKKKVLDLNFKNKSININVKLIDTGLNTGTGGRIKIAYETLKLNADIIMTYGDGLSSIPIKKLLNFHKENKSILTISAVRPKQKYGVLKIKNKKLNYFDNSKSKSDIYINGGFHVISNVCIKKIKNNSIYWEKEPLSYFLKKKKIFVYKYDGFWKSLDTLKDKNDFNKLYKEKKFYWRLKN